MMYIAGTPSADGGRSPKAAESRTAPYHTTVQPLAFSGLPLVAGTARDQTLSTIWPPGPPEGPKRRENMAYNLEGSLLEVCTCNVICPCWVGEDPDGGACDGLI